MKDKEIEVKDIKGKVEKIKLSEIEEISASILKSYRCWCIEIITKNKSIKSVAYLNNSDDPLTEIFIKILKYFYNKKGNKNE